MSNIKYALALAGGGTRGAFECGVWKALCEMGINVCAIAGTSIGAVNGAMFASGEDAFSLWKNVSADDIMKLPKTSSGFAANIVSVLKSISRGGIDTSPFRDFLNKHLSEEKVRKSPIQFGLCTYSVDDKSELDLFTDDIPEGKLIDYILASACFPLFKPSVIDNKIYSDGAVRNNLPVNMLIEKGFDTIISVSVKGIGIINDADICGANIIEINCPSAEVGILDFDKNSIMRSIDSGYCECMKVFGKYDGYRFSFYAESYREATALYGRQMIKQLETAARLLKIYPYRAYTVDNLIKSVLAEYKKNKRLDKLVSFMLKEKHGAVHEKLDILGRYFDAANAIVYFKKITPMSKSDAK